MLQWYNRTFHTAIIASDLTLIAIALYLGAIHAGSVPVGGWAPHWQTAIVFASWFVVTCKLSIYRSKRTHGLLSELQAIAAAWGITLCVGGFVGIALAGAVFYEPMQTAAWGLLFLTAERFAIRTVLSSLRVSGRNFRRVLLVGDGPAAASIVRSLQQNRQFGIRVAGYAAFSNGNGGGHLPGVQRVGDVADFEGIIARDAYDTVVLCPAPTTRIGEMNRVFALCDEAGIRCSYTPHFEHLNLHPAVDLFADHPAISFEAQRPAPIQQPVKRLLDIVVSAALLVALIPFWIVVVVLIKLQDRGPILFRQLRVGENGRLFTCFKFRTMCVDAELRKLDLLDRNEQDGPVFKIIDDPRITRLGRFLRRYSLDELPQLFNVFIGDMSLVGPRPPTPDEVERYEWWQRRRLSVRPGITCIWQVWGRNKVTFRRWLEMDLYYIDNWSLWMDLKLLYHTVFVVMRGTGS